VELLEGTFEFLDNYNNKRNGNQRLIPIAAVVGTKRHRNAHDAAARDGRRAARLTPFDHRARRFIAVESLRPPQRLTSLVFSAGLRQVSSEALGPFGTWRQGSALACAQSRRAILLAPYQLLSTW